MIQSQFVTFAKVWWEKNCWIFLCHCLGKLLIESMAQVIQSMLCSHILFIVNYNFKVLRCANETKVRCIVHTKRKTITIQFSSVNSHWMNVFFTEQKKIRFSYTFDTLYTYPSRVSIRGCTVQQWIFFVAFVYVVLYCFIASFLFGWWKKYGILQVTAFSEHWNWNSETLQFETVSMFCTTDFHQISFFLNRT